LSGGRRKTLPPPRGPLATAGDVVAFGARTAISLGHARPYAGEALRQAATIAVGSTGVILFIAFMAGGSCGLEASTLARAFGTRPVAAGFSSWCTMREVVPFVFGYVLAAKVGCGMVAELGAMRAAEEVDALETIGTRPLAYLVATRAIGAALVLPFAYVLALGSSFAAAYLMSVVRFGDVSPGTWHLFFFMWQDGADLAYSLLKGLAIATFVVTVSLYYGYSVRGGAVEVGLSTARSMAVNIVGVTLISMTGTLVFWGANPRLPFG
jgi:phospholipid/cholesterol/gamma-HCH transport system permease protein